MSKSKKKDALSVSEILRIVLPEIQVLDYIKEKGFFNKGYFDKGKAEIANAALNAKKKVEESSSSASNAINNINTKVKSAGSAVSAAASKGIGNTSVDKSAFSKVSSPKTAMKSKVSTNSNSSSKTKNPGKEGIDKSFASIESKLPDYVLGQRDYLSKLTIAFKRPFVYGKKDGVKNTIFITGPNGSGRHLSVKAMTKFLKEEKLIKDGSFHSIDLGVYKTEKDADNLFLSDIYNGLYGTSEVIVFDNFDKCHQNVLDLLNKLVIHEKIKLDRRYLDQFGKMVDVTGKNNLTLNTTDEISCNGKFLVFITDNNEDAIRNKFSNDFMKKVYDIIKTVSLDNKSLYTICNYILNEYREKIKTNLSLNLSYDKSAADFVIKNFDKGSGAHGLYNFIEENIYAPLVEFELNSSINKDVSYTLKYENDELVLLNGTEALKVPALKRYTDNTNVEELNKELENIIGLKNVKDFIKKLEDNIKVQNMRRAQGSKEAKLSLHMIFTGNPGTGKTTMARIMAKYLKALGYLSSGHLVEVSRNDLVGQYVGETAQKTMNKVNQALGGILFIDEAYSLARDENDVFGVEAVDTIVKAVEDNRDNLVVILAGYTDEMESFLETNSGLKSRFNYNVEFEDYTSGELLKISKNIAKSNGYVIDESLDEALLKLFEGKQIKGKNDSGNGRLARNIVEKAIANQSNRLAALDEKEIDSSEINKLNLSDFGLDEKAEFNLEEELNKIVGLDEVKNLVRDLQKQLKAQEMRKKVGVNVETSGSLNMIFTGNPGTGKTTVARLIGSLMSNMGILKSGKVVETDRSGLIGQHTGETTKKVTKVFKSALGGVLFIDEAYSLMSSPNDPYGKEAVDTLVKLIEDFRQDIVVILAGYNKEISEFLDTNSGLKSRFPLNMHFADYSVEELMKIGKMNIESRGFKLSPDAEDEFEALIRKEKQASGAKSGNGRMVRNIVEKAIRDQSSRIADMGSLDEESVVLLTEEDFKGANTTKESLDLEERFKDIVGLSEVKDFIRSLQAQLKMREKRKSLGLDADETQTLHMIFKGNPGTGKTTMARIVGEVLYNLGVLTSKTFVETDRSGLVAGYVGQTAIKTKEVIDSALGGILFIDEAYALAQDAGSGSGFGKEAIDTLVKGMDDNRDNLVVILAGYSDDMDKFLEVNPGLKSRFANIIEFKDYTSEELLVIADKLFKNKGYIITKEARDKMKAIFDEVQGTSDFGNGRYVRNLFEKAVRNQAVRLEKIDNLTKEDLMTIEKSDVSKVNV